MNESYFLYCEDVDWSLRRGRFRLGYAHDAVILHVAARQPAKYRDRAQI